MLSITILCVGKLKEKYFLDASNEYIKRLSLFCNLKITEISEYRLKENPSQSEINAGLEDEGTQILKNIFPKDFCVALFIDGKKLSSEELASLMEEKAVSGISSIVFVIGSSFGLAKSVKDRANLCLSFSKMTFPHQLMRVILLEQVYRAFTILSKKSYHK
jgi:23S rRNA (pseudouridine1915-N3)-methyltransferase